MRTVVQEWIDIQNQPITTESDIWIYFYQGNTTTVDKILTKQNIRNFSYRQSGSVINKRYPIKEITFDMFTFCGNAPKFELGTLCCVVFKYKKQDDSAWLSCVIGSFRVVDRTIKANGLTANYTLNNTFFATYSSYSQTVSVNDITSSKYRYGSNRYGRGGDDGNFDFTLRYLSNRMGLAVPSTTQTRKAVGKSLPVVSILDGLQMCAVCGGYTLQIGANSTSIVPYNNGGSFRSILPTTSADSSYVVRQGVCYQKPEIIQDEIVKTIEINEYKNEKGEYVLGTINEMSGCSFFSVSFDESGDYDSSHQNGYWGYTSIDPSKYWYELVDKDGDDYFALDENTIAGWADFEYSGYVIYPLMKTTYSVNSSTISGIDKGTSIVIDNCLINSNYSSAVMTFMKNWLAKNEVLELVGRFDPRLELFDMINVIFDNRLYKILVEDFNLSYNGGFSGKILGRICDTNENLNYFAIKKVGGTQTSQLSFVNEGSASATLEYSYDRINWTTYSSPLTLDNRKIYFRGNNATMSSTSANYSHFVATNDAQLQVSGDISSLYDKTMANKTIPTTDFFSRLFLNETHIVDASELVLSPTTLTQNCYMYMFMGCTNLIKAPKELNVSSFPIQCCGSMFKDCSSLTQGMNIVADTMNDYSCCYMYQNCTSLVNAPTLNITSIGNYSLGYMFDGCTSLVQMPTLPMTTLGQYSCSQMFSGCTSLKRTAPMLATTVDEGSCYRMFYGCTNLETLVALHTLELKKWCYRDMFRSCSKIKVDETQSSGQHTYRIPDTGTGTNVGLTGLTSMFVDTIGTMNYTPVVNTTYYTSNEVI